MLEVLTDGDGAEQGYEDQIGWDVAVEGDYS